MEGGLGWKGGRKGREVIEVSFLLVTRSCEAGAVLEGGREGEGGSRCCMLRAKRA